MAWVMEELLLLLVRGGTRMVVGGRGLMMAAAPGGLCCWLLLAVLELRMRRGLLKAPSRLVHCYCPLKQRRCLSAQQ